MGPAAAALPGRALIDNARLVTLAGGEGPLRGARQGELGEVPSGAVAVEDGRILLAGGREAVLRGAEAAWGGLADVEALDAGGRALLPGLVDAHTHPIWAGSRAAELEMRIRGAGYVEIMAAGGGIASTVRATRAAGDDALMGGLLARLDELMDHGVSTVEAKSGYGLSADEELRQLDLLARAAHERPLRIVPTFLGAHAVPEEYRGREDAYVDLVVEVMLPRVAAAYPGIFCDVFCDVGAFSLAQTERILLRARELGLALKVHADEFGHLGCAALAAGMGATSADHCIVTTPAEMEAMAASGTVAVLLPGTTLGLGSTGFAPAREMIGRGVAVALGTDLNPGTCPCPNLPLIMAMAARYLRLSPAEALAAATRNAAFACGRGEQVGRIQEGFAADLLLLEGEDYRDLCYGFGGAPRLRLMIGGRWRR